MKQNNSTYKRTENIPAYVLHLGAALQEHQFGSTRRAIRMLRAAAREVPPTLEEIPPLYGPLVAVGLAYSDMHCVYVLNKAIRNRKWYPLCTYRLPYMDRLDDFQQRFAYHKRRVELRKKRDAGMLDRLDPANPEARKVYNAYIAKSI